MSEVKIRKLSQKAFVKRYGHSGPYSDDYRYMEYGMHQRRIEQSLNSLIELIKAQRQGSLPADSRALLGDIVDDYRDQQTEWLDEPDQRLFRDLFRRFGVQVIRPAPLSQVLQDMAGYDMSDGLPSTYFEVIRSSDFRSQLDTWQAIDIVLPPAQDDVLRVAEQASVADPLGLLSPYGLYLNLCRTAKTSTHDRGSKLTIKAVTITFMGVYLRRTEAGSYGRRAGQYIDYTLNSDTDRLFSVTLSCDSGSDDYQTVRIQPQDS